MFLKTKYLWGGKTYRGIGKQGLSFAILFILFPVSMGIGSLSERIDNGKTGFIASNEKQLVLWFSFVRHIVHSNVIIIRLPFVFAINLCFAHYIIY